MGIADPEIFNSFVVTVQGSFVKPHSRTRNVIHESVIVRFALLVRQDRVPNLDRIKILCRNSEFRIGISYDRNTASKAKNSDISSRIDRIRFDAQRDKIPDNFRVTRRTNVRTVDLVYRHPGLGVNVCHQLAFVRIRALVGERDRLRDRISGLSFDLFKILVAEHLRFLETILKKHDRVAFLVF